MSPVSATCAGCGALVVFRHDAALVTICAYCHSVVARSDRGVETLGKLADLAETGSPLRVGLSGSFRGGPFELVGRAQLRHAQGGLWDEWYGLFANGNWGWLGEAQGRFLLTFRHEGAAELPRFEHLAPGQRISPLRGASFVVAELGDAEYVAAEADLPFRLEPGTRFRYADLSGADGSFATIDFSEEAPVLYVGREVTLAELGLAEVARAEGGSPGSAGVGTERLACPECDGNLELRAPERTERLACPYCGSLLDVTQGKLVLLEAQRQAPKPRLPLGAEATFFGERMQIIGWLERSVTAYGVRYPWEEHLLYHPRVGFRWLVCSEGHWSLVEPLPAGGVEDRGGGASFEGRMHKFFQSGTARVDRVLGELYWKVVAGEEVNTVDYVAPPTMLSKELSSGELSWSLGTWLPPGEVEKAFGVEQPAPVGVGVIQPFRHKWVYALWGLFALVAVLGFGVAAARSSTVVFEEAVPLEDEASETQPSIYFSQPLELAAGKNLRITVEAAADNAWVFVQGDLFAEESGLVQEFAVPVEYYSGVEEGEAWSEGSRKGATWLSALPAGSYTLRLEISHGGNRPPDAVLVKVEQGVARFAHLLWLIGLLSAIPLLTIYRQFTFEKERWSKSDVGGDEDE